MADAGMKLSASSVTPSHAQRPTQAEIRDIAGLSRIVVTPAIRHSDAAAPCLGKSESSALRPAPRGIGWCRSALEMKMRADRG